jgi:ubiquinone/menaquinone biosynthesis C-methylase UbiE
MTPEPETTSLLAQRRIEQAVAFDQIGERYDEAFPHKEGQLEAGQWLIERLEPGARVLDVGCGTGTPTARQLADAGMRVTGIDISAGMLDLARRNVPQATFLELDAMDVTDSGFDAVVAFFSLLMLRRDDIPATLARLCEALVPGGHLLLSMVEADLDDTMIPFLGNPVRVTGYLRDELRSVVEGAGFTVLDLRTLSYAPASTEAYPEVQLFVYASRSDG